MNGGHGRMTTAGGARFRPRSRRSPSPWRSAPRRAAPASRRAPTGRRGRKANGPRDPEPLPPVTLPDLSSLLEPVQERLRAPWDALNALLAGGNATPAELAAAYGELGIIMMVAEFFETAEACFLHAHAHTAVRPAVAVLSRPPLPHRRGAGGGGGVLRAHPRPAAERPGGPGLARRDVPAARPHGGGGAALPPRAGARRRVRGGAVGSGARRAGPRGLRAGGGLPGARGGLRPRRDQPLLPARARLRRAGRRRGRPRRTWRGAATG